MIDELKKLREEHGALLLYALRMREAIIDLDGDTPGAPTELSDARIKEIHDLIASEPADAVFAVRAQAMRDTHDAIVEHLEKNTTVADMAVSLVASIRIVICQKVLGTVNHSDWNTSVVERREDLDVKQEG